MEGSIRTYRLSRMHAVATLDEHFDRPDGFDLQEHWAGYQRDYEERIFTGTATIRLSPAGRELLFLIGSPAARAGHQAMAKADENGWARTVVPIESVRHALHALLQLGEHVEVLEPAELREAILECLRVAATRYR